MAGEGQLARPVRIGLEENLAETTVMNSSEEKSYLDELSFGKPIRQHVKEFGALFGLIALVFIAWAIYKRIDPVWTTVASAVAIFFLGTGYFAPTVLHPLWKAWMGLAHFLGTIMTFLILSVAWTIMMVPMAILLKVIGKKVMDMSFDRSVESYWVERDQKKHDFKLLETQY